MMVDSFNGNLDSEDHQVQYVGGIMWYFPHIQSFLHLGDSSTESNILRFASIFQFFQCYFIWFTITLTLDYMAL